MDGNIIEIRDLSYSYPDGTLALQGLSLAMPEGKRIAVLGANGSGKTTLFLCLNGLLRPRQGKIFYRGEELRYDKKSLLRLRSRLGIVFQDPEIQLFASSVRQEVAFGPLNLGLEEREALVRVEEALCLTGTKDLEQKAPHMLSYGQKKQVAIASVLAMRPEILIGDEPTAWLDRQHACRVMELLHEISAKGTTVIISTHDADLAYSWAEEVIVLQKGKLLSSGPPEHVFQAGEMLAAAGLGQPLLLQLFLLLKGKGYILEGAAAPRTPEALAGLLKGGS